MTTGPMTAVMHHLRGTVRLCEARALSDGQLLEAFVARRDEVAFETLVRRHGPMVLGVCRRVLGNLQDAEDTFQAAFLVLARKAAAVTPRELLGHWLYGVAYRTALKARALAARRQLRERQVREMPEREVHAEETWADLQPLLDHELSRLPEKYRVPLVLCELEGKSKREVAFHLGLPQGTVSSRLARAREALRRRLTQRGLAFSAGALTTALTGLGTSAAVPSPLVLATVKAAVPFAAGGAAVAAVPASIAALTEGVLKAMLLTKLKLGAVLLLTLGTLVLGVGAIVNRVLARPATATREERPPENDVQQGPADARARDNTKSDDDPDQKSKTKDRKADRGDRRFRAEETITKSFKTKGTARLEVQTFNGPIEVKIGDKGAVKATVVKSTREKSEEAAKEDLKNVEVTMAQEGDTVRVTARPAEPKSPGERGAAVEVEVPPETVLDLRTDNGPVKVNGATGDVTADTINGPIHVRGGKGKLQLTTKNGGIDVEGGAGQIEARTSNGSIKIKTENAVVNAHTKNGAVHFAGKLSKGDHSFETSNGSIVLTLPRDAQFRVDAETSLGTITSRFPLDWKKGKGRISLQGTMGDKPTATIKLRTSLGSVEINPEK
jgi:RNA polymerase sigma factor (sigma-70 family)